MYNTTIKSLLSKKQFLHLHPLPEFWLQTLQLDSKNTKYRTPAFCLNIGNTCYDPRIINVHLYPSSKFLPLCETPDFKHLSGILEAKYTESAKLHNRGSKMTLHL